MLWDEHHVAQAIHMNIRQSARAFLNEAPLQKDKLEPSAYGPTGHHTTDQRRRVKAPFKVPGTSPHRER